MYKESKPYTRWWWFSNEIRKDDIRYQLDWLKENNFGGVEIAWVYKLPDGKPGPKWLSGEWSRIVAYTKDYAQSIGLGCDFTFGTLWPFGGSTVDERDAARTFDGLSSQRLRKSWDEDDCPEGYILNHLDQNALERYAHKMGSALTDALKGKTPALFCDSWEVATEKLWTEGFGKAFREKFGYDITTFMNDIDRHPDARYDYRRLIADYVLNEFYKPFTAICHRLGALARVQCHGAPTDLVGAYSVVDVPESEAILFDPHFSQFAASAAALTGKKIVSAESFTCLYGWKPWPGPSQYQKYEMITDIKLLADALFANGVNFFVWHGMPFNPEGGNNRFYASVHVGPDSFFAEELTEFNRYLERVSGFMRRGKVYSDIAVYLPLEDNWMKDILPGELERPSAKHYWEMQYQRFPQELIGYRPLWVSSYFLKDADYHDGKLMVGKAEFSSLFVDVEWLDREVLSEILRLARAGLPICIRRKPAQPGLRKSKDYDDMLGELFSLKNVGGDIRKFVVNPPLVEGSEVPEYWCRIDGDCRLIFFAHPKTKELKYPMTYGQSYCREEIRIGLNLNANHRSNKIELNFKPYQSVFAIIDNDGKVHFEDIYYQPRSIKCQHGPRRNSYALK